MTRILFRINILYSFIWIAVNHSDKYAYREQSKVHAWIVSHYC